MHCTSPTHAHHICTSRAHLRYNKSITDVDLSGTGVDTQAACSLAVAFNHNSSITSLDLSNNPLCTLDQPVYNLQGEDFKGVYALAQVLSCSPLSLMTTDGLAD